MAEMERGNFYMISSRGRSLFTLDLIFCGSYFNTKIVIPPNLSKGDAFERLHKLTRHVRKMELSAMIMVIEERKRWMEMNELNKQKDLGIKKLKRIFRQRIKHGQDVPLWLADRMRMSAVDMRDIEYSYNEACALYQWEGKEETR